jgi:hypothetical protein
LEMNPAMGWTPCSRCHGLQREKLASIYWHWFVEDIRHAWKEGFCDDCLDATLRPLADHQVLREHNRDNATCDNCGIGLGHTEMLRLTGVCFLRGNDPVQLRLMFCETCADVARGQIATSGELLPERGTFDVASARSAKPRPLAPLAS